MSQQAHLPCVRTRSFSAVCRGLLSLEDIPYADNGQQTIILLPKALQITDAVAKAVLADKLSAGSIQDLEVDKPGSDLIASISSYCRSQGLENKQKVCLADNAPLRLQISRTSDYLRNSWHLT